MILIHFFVNHVIWHMQWGKTFVWVILKFVEDGTNKIGRAQAQIFASPMRKDYTIDIEEIDLSLCLKVADSLFERESWDSQMRILLEAHAWIMWNFKTRFSLSLSLSNSHRLLANLRAVLNLLVMRSRFLWS
jgi:hypothetical protein